MKLNQKLNSTHVTEIRDVKSAFNLLLHPCGRQRFKSVFNAVRDVEPVQERRL